MKTKKLTIKVHNDYLEWFSSTGVEGAEFYNTLSDIENILFNLRKRFNVKLSQIVIFDIRFPENKNDLDT